MSKKKLKLATYLAISVFLTLGLSISFQSLLAAWVEPTSDPIAGNVPAPINVGSDLQTKTGTLGLSATNALFITGHIYDSIDNEVTVDSSLTVSATHQFNGDGSGLTNLPWGSLTNIPPDIDDGDDDTTYTAGAGLDLIGGAFSHQDTSSQNSSNNSGYTFIQDISLDTYGHVTSLAVGSVSGDNLGNHTATQNLNMNGHNVINAGAFYYSDRSLKENIQTIVSPLDKILQLEGITFDWKKDGEDGIGLIAQDLEQVFPELVHTDDDGLKSVGYANLVAPLIEAIKEQQKQIEELKNKIKNLK